MRRKNTARRNRILESARKLFAMKGFNETIVQDITDDAQVNKARLFYYFDSKENLYVTIVEDIIKKILEDVRGNLFSHADAETMIRNHIRIVMKNFLEHGDVFRVLFAEVMGPNANYSPVIEKFEEDILKMTAEIVSRGIREGIFKEVDPTIASMGLMGMAHLLYKKRIYIHLPLDTNTLDAHTAEIFLHGIKK